MRAADRGDKKIILGFLLWLGAGRVLAGIGDGQRSLAVLPTEPLVFLKVFRGLGEACGSEREGVT